MGLYLFLQISLCFILYLFINLGKIQKPVFPIKIGERPVIDMYFISVSGGFRHVQEQTRLLKMIERVVAAHGASFVINISEFGDDDPLIQNATQYSLLHKLHWFTTSAFKRQKPGYFIQQFKIPYGETLDVVAMDSGSLQDPPSKSETGQMEWLKRILEASNSTWRIATGFHQLISCQENTEQVDGKKKLDSVYHLLLEYGVNAYLSRSSCPYAANNGLTESMNSTVPNGKGPYITSVNQRTLYNREMPKGFLLHRVTPLELETYSVTLKGQIKHIVTQQHMGKEFM